MMKSKHRRRTPVQERKGPGLLFVLVALAAVAMVSARFLGFTPESLLTSADRMLNTSTSGPTAALDVTTRGEPIAPANRDLPRVLIYHAHASENYSPNPTHARAGNPGDIVEVGKALAAALEERGVRTIHMTGVFDNPWRDAYSASAMAVSQVLQANPSIQLVIDLHRDAVESRQAGVGTAQVDAARTAKVLFTIGELDNPYVQANATMATRVKDELDRYYPGLSRGVRMFKQESNGRLHPSALEVHVGDYYDSTLGEAKSTARYLAEVLATMLN